MLILTSKSGHFICVRVKWTLGSKVLNGRPYPTTGSGRQCPQLPRRLAYLGPIQRAVVRSQGLVASSPLPVGASGQQGKEQALPCAENLFTRCGVRLCEYDGTPHGRACPSRAELPEFLQRQECGITETVSEAPGAYGIHSCSHAARVASYETPSALATLPSPKVGMAARNTSSKYHSAVSALPEPLDGPCLSTGRELLEQVSRHTVVTKYASSMGWGATCNGQAASGRLSACASQAKAPSTRQTYALKWSLFANWCSSSREDPRRCTTGVVISFLH